jgi:S-formylglutathione hydrolase FrmB
MRRSIILVLAAAVLCPAGAARAATSFHSGEGLRVSATQRLDARLVDVTVRTSSLPGPAHIRIMLPTGYGSHPARRYPVLYLLHGTSGGAADWTALGGAEQTTAGKPLIVVMPDIALNDDGGGWCTNWPRSTPAGRPQWETFHIDQLIPWIDANLRTVASRGGRAIAGLSQGGFCSISYAARHPDVFGTALAYSGAPDIAWDATARALVTPIINATELALDHVPANSMFGPRTSEELNWAAHDPTTLAGNLRGTKLFLYTGNGSPGPLDPPGAGSSVIETGVHVLTQLFHDRLQSLGIPSFYDDYGPGTHSWTYWTRDLRQSIGPIMNVFAHPPRMPAHFDYTSAEDRYSIYGWRVAMHRAVEEFSTLTGAGASGFVLKGSGSATVTTPPVYHTGARYQITVRSRSGPKRVVRRVGASHSLTIDLPLGPSNRVQEFQPSADTKVYVTQVEIRLR